MLQNKNGNSKFKDLIKQNLKQLILANRLAFRGKQQDRDIGCEQNIYRYTQRKTIYFIMKLLDRMHYSNRKKQIQWGQPKARFLEQSV